MGYNKGPETCPDKTARNKAGVNKRTLPGSITDLHMPSMRAGLSNGNKFRKESHLRYWSFYCQKFQIDREGFANFSGNGTIGVEQIKHEVHILACFLCYVLIFLGGKEKIIIQLYMPKERSGQSNNTTTAYLAGHRVLTPIRDM